MKKLLPTLLPLLSTAIIAIVPDLQHYIIAFVSAHPALSSFATAAALILNHWLPSPGSPPSDSTIAKAGTALMLCFALTATPFLTGCTPQTVLDQVIADIPIATDIALSAVNIYEATDGVKELQVAAEIQEYSGEVATDLKLLSSLLAEYKATPDDGVLKRLDAAFNTAQGHLGDLFNAFHVTSPRTQAAASAVFNLVHGILLNVANLLPPDKTTVAPQAAQVVARATALGPPAPVFKPKDLASYFNSQMKNLSVNVQVHAH
jgi:hypothetical protein